MEAIKSDTRSRSKSVSYKIATGNDNESTTRGRSQSVSLNNRARSESVNSRGSEVGSSDNASWSSDDQEEMMLDRMASSALADVTSFRVDKLTDFNLPPIMVMQLQQGNPSPRLGLFDSPKSRTEVSADQQAYQVDELLRLRFQMEELKQRKEALEDDITKWEMVHKAISNLYLEVSDTMLDDVKREEEKNRKLTRIDIRTELRGLMGIKAEFDKEIIIELEKKQAEFDRQLDAEHRKIADMTKANEELQQKLDQANAQLKEISTAKEQDLQEASQQQKQIEEELQTMKELNQQKDSGIEERQTQLAKLHQLIKTKDSKLTKLSELEARIQQLTSLHDAERQQHQLEVQKLKDKCVALNERANYTAEAKKKLEDELKTITEKMMDIKKHNYFNDYTEVAKRFERLTNTADTQSTQLRRTEDELKKAKQMNEDYTAKIKELERECGRSQFSTTPSIKKKEKAQAISEEQYRKVINESPHYVDAYKSLLREKEAQIKDLTTKLRSLLVQSNTTVKKPAVRRQQTTSDPPPQSRPSDGPSSLPEQWVTKQMHIIEKASVHMPNKNRDTGVNSTEGSEMGEEESGNNDGAGEGVGREKWMQGLKTPNMRTIKILKSPSEKEYPRT